MTVAKPNRLRAVPRLAGKIGFDYRFDVASQVIAAGNQDTHVQALIPLSGPGKGQIGVRVGRLLVYVANREALQSFLDAWAEAAALADQAFGPEMPMPRFGESDTAEYQREGLRQPTGAPPVVHVSGRSRALPSVLRCLETGHVVLRGGGIVLPADASTDAVDSGFVKR